MGFNFKNPVKLVFGVNKSSELENEVKNRKALLITSNGFVKRGIVKKIQDQDILIKDIISDVSSHPTFEYLKKIYNELDHNSFDVIIALGGGSVIDASKVVSLYNNSKEFQFVETFIKKRKKNEYYNLKPVIAIPTTAGTGSELTPWATVWDDKEKKKYSLHLEELWCETAIYDPCLTLTVPKDITIQTGLDAISQCFEAIWNINANPISTTLAISAAKEIYITLPLLINDLENLQLRTRMMEACIKMGLAFSNTQTSIAHAISYYITANKGVPHGIACSFTIPWIIDIVLNEKEDLDNALHSILGDSIEDNIRKFFRDLDIETDLQNYGLTKHDFNEIYEQIFSNQRAKNFPFIDKFSKKWFALTN